MMQMTNEYQKNSVMTSDGVGVIVLLYEGVVNFNNQAKAAIEEGKIEERNRFINKSSAIISELYNALDMERGGQVAENLNRLYSYMLEQLNGANRNNDCRALDLVSRLISELKEGWVGIRGTAKAASAAPDMKDYSPLSASV